MEAAGLALGALELTPTIASLITTLFSTMGEAGLDMHATHNRLGRMGELLRRLQQVHNQEQPSGLGKSLPWLQDQCGHILQGLNKVMSKYYGDRINWGALKVWKKPLPEEVAALQERLDRLIAQLSLELQVQHIMEKAASTGTEESGPGNAINPHHSGNRPAEMPYRLAAGGHDQEASRNVKSAQALIQTAEEALAELTSLQVTLGQGRLPNNPVDKDIVALRTVLDKVKKLIPSDTPHPKRWIKTLTSSRFKGRKEFEKHLPVLLENMDKAQQHIDRLKPMDEGIRKQHQGVAGIHEQEEQAENRNARGFDRLNRALGY